MQKNRYVDEVTKILNDPDLPNRDDHKDDKEDEIETIHLYIYKEEPKKNSNIVEANITKDKTHPFIFVLTLFFASLLPIFSIAFQVFVLFNPLIATITISSVQKV